MECSFALLSGGNSRRFNDDKTKALLNGTPLYKYGLECGLLISDDVIHISKNKEKYKPFIKGVKYIEDEFFATGKDIVKFYIATNIGEEEK